MNEVVELATFIDSAEGVLTEKEILALTGDLATNPTKGDVIPRSSGLRKVRVAAKGKGKRGGARCIYVYFAKDEIVYLIAAYAKNEKEDLTSSEIKAISQMVKALE